MFPKTWQPFPVKHGNLSRNSFQAQFSCPLNLLLPRIGQFVPLLSTDGSFPLHHRIALSLSSAPVPSLCLHCWLPHNLFLSLVNLPPSVLGFPSLCKASIPPTHLSFLMGVAFKRGTYLISTIGCRPPVPAPMKSIPFCFSFLHIYSAPRMPQS